MDDRIVTDFIDDYINAIRERNAAWDEMDKLAYDYNQLAVELCHVEDQLAEAREIARELAALAKKMLRFGVAVTTDGDLDELVSVAAVARAMDAIRPGVRKWLEE